MEHVSTKLTSSEANDFFGVSNSFTFDSNTLETTLRFIAILHSDQPIEKVALFKTGSSTFSSRINADECAVDVECTSKNIAFYVSKSGAEIPTAITAEGWVSMDTPPFPVAPFLSGASQTSVFVNTEKRKVLIFVKRATEKWIDKLCSSLFRILPWVYPTEESISEQEKELFKSINSGDSNKFKEIIDSCCANIDFRAIMARKVLIGWGDNQRQSQISKLKSDIESTRTRIDDKQRELSGLLNDLSLMNMNLNAIVNVPDDEQSDALFKFFESHKQLGIYRTSTLLRGDKVLKYSVRETIEYYDEDQFKRLYENPSSFFCRKASEDVKKVFYAIFAENRGSFRTEAIFSMTNLSSLTAVSGEFEASLSGTHIPHPHIYHHACLGGNRTHINSYMQSGDWELAIEQSIAATKNINFGDSTVISEMISDVASRRDSCRCIIADNGAEMTPNEFLAYISTNTTNGEEGVNNG